MAEIKAAQSQTNGAPGILAFGRAIEERVEELQVRKRWCHACVALVVSGGVLAGPTYAYYGAVLGFLVELTAFGLRYRASVLHGTSRRAMRRVALVAANFLTEDSIEVAVVRAQLAVVSEHRQRSEAWEAANSERTYYSTRAAEPDERLLDILFECAFWWVALTEEAARRAGRWLIAGGGGVLALLMLGLVVLHLEARQLLGTLAIQVGLILVGVDLVENYLGWRDAGAEARELLSRVPAVPPREQALLFLWLADYFALTARCPPVPRKIYEAHRDTIDAECCRLLEQREDGRTGRTQK